MAEYEFEYKSLGLLKDLHVGDTFVLEGRNIPYEILKKENDIVFYIREFPNPNPNIKTGKSYPKYLPYRDKYSKNGNIEVYDIIKIN